MPLCRTRVWTVPGIPPLECFRAVNFVHEYPRHSHATGAIGVVNDGAGGIWYRGADERSGPGELITIRPGEVHIGYPLQRCGISYSMLYVGEEQVKEILPQAVTLPAFSRVTVREPQLPIRMRRLCRALESGGGPSFKTASTRAESMRAAVEGS
jgi:hypothetical protein